MEDWWSPRGVHDSTPLWSWSWLDASQQTASGDGDYNHLWRSSLHPDSRVMMRSNEIKNQGLWWFQRLPVHFVGNDVMNGVDVHANKVLDQCQMKNESFICESLFAWTSCIIDVVCAVSAQVGLKIVFARTNIVRFARTALQCWRSSLIWLQQLLKYTLCCSTLLKKTFTLWSLRLTTIHCWRLRGTWLTRSLLYKLLGSKNVIDKFVKTDYIEKEVKE